MASFCNRLDRAARRRMPVLLGVLCVCAAAARADGTAEVPLCPPLPVTAAQRALPNKVRLVTGAPYSALGTSETVTTLADGNRIVRQNEIRMWRDSDGRTRSEFSLSSVGGPPPLELNTTVTVIDDPGARERYVLQPGQKVAVTVPIAPCRMNPIEGEPDFVGPVRAPPGAFNLSARQQLGERNVNGEIVSGSRIEATIPAGSIGNDQPIRMSAEQWYGRDLQVVVEATYRDPRTGDTRYKLRDIKRAEPDASLFLVPKGYERKSPGPDPRRRQRQEFSNR
jgi:hypothetical protein